MLYVVLLKFSFVEEVFFIDDDGYLNVVISDFSDFVGFGGYDIGVDVDFFFFENFFGQFEKDLVVVFWYYFFWLVDIDVGCVILVQFDDGYYCSLFQL